MSSEIGTTTPWLEPEIEELAGRFLNWASRLAAWKSLRPARVLKVSERCTVIGWLLRIFKSVTSAVSVSTSGAAPNILPSGTGFPSVS
jgi:hypothetical protein